MTTTNGSTSSTNNKHNNKPINTDAYKIYLYIPNIIGYLRVTLSLLSFFLYETYPKLVLIMYTLSFLLDGLDGIAARHYNQCSRFGAVLDMVTDRFSTAALITILCKFYPNYIFLFILLNILDFISHWIRMYVGLVLGNTSHKDVDWNRSYLLALYYTNKLFMAILCVGNELFYIYLYALYFYNDLLNPNKTILGFIIFYILLVPTWGGKQVMNFIQMYQSANELVEYEYEHDVHHKKN
ncbi:hypothetical protein ABK040_004014 [Willaertia magna]